MSNNTTKYNLMTGINYRGGYTVKLLRSLPRWDVPLTTFTENDPVKTQRETKLLPEKIFHIRKAVDSVAQSSREIVLRELP